MVVVWEMESPWERVLEKSNEAWSDKGTTANGMRNGMDVKSHLFNSGPSSVLRGRGLAPLRGVLDEVTELADGLTVAEERVLSVPVVPVSLLELVVELMRLSRASFPFIVRPGARTELGDWAWLHDMGHRREKRVKVGRFRSGQIMSRQSTRMWRCGARLLDRSKAKQGKVIFTRRFRERWAASANG